MKPVIHMNSTSICPPRPEPIGPSAVAQLSLPGAPTGKRLMGTSGGFTKANAKHGEVLGVLGCAWYSTNSLSVDVPVVLSMGQ